MAQKFSDQLEQWLKSKGRKTLADLEKVFGPKSFAITFLLLMAAPALPLPTAGITHIFEIIIMLLCLQLFIGRETIWLPKRWRNTSLSSPRKIKVIAGIMKFVRFFERFSRPRLIKIVSSRFYLRVVAVLIFALTLSAFLAPPFSGLDTLPALGVVIISLSIILEDAALLFIGLLVGVFGVVLEVTIGAEAFKFFHNFFKN